MGHIWLSDLTGLVLEVVCFVFCFLFFFLVMDWMLIFKTKISCENPYFWFSEISGSGHSEPSLFLVVVMKEVASPFLRLWKSMFDSLETKSSRDACPPQSLWQEMGGGRVRIDWLPLDLGLGVVPQRKPGCPDQRQGQEMLGRQSHR